MTITPLAPREPYWLAVPASFNTSIRATSLGAMSASAAAPAVLGTRSEEHTSDLQSRENLVCRLLLEKKKQKNTHLHHQLLRIDRPNRHVPSLPHLRH